MRAPGSQRRSEANTHSSSLSAKRILQQNSLAQHWARAQPSPRRDAPSPLAFAKSCKGGDVSVLDPALAWDDRFIYLFIYLLPIPRLVCLFLSLFIAEAFVVNRKRREGSHVTRSRTDKRTHTAPLTRTPPPRLGRRETRGWSSPKEGIQTRMGGEFVVASRCPAPRDSPALVGQEGDVFFLQEAFVN